MSPDVVSEGGRLFGWGLVGAFTLEIFGLPVQPIIFALMGGMFGQGWAKPDDKWWRRFLAYMFAAFLSAAAGDLVATHMVWGPKAANMLAAGFAIFFNPILANLAPRVPAGIDWFFAIWSRRGQ